MKKVCKTEFTVRFSECDWYQHVNNAVYISYMDTAITHFLKQSIGRKGFDFTMHIVHVQADFFGAATFDDVLIVETSLNETGNSSVVFDLKITEKKSGKLIVKGQKVGVFLDTNTGKKISVPSKLKELV